jgi:hypothetical protein
MGDINLTVKNLIEHLSKLNQDSEVLVSCEGGCVVDGDIAILENNGTAYIEIE